MLRRAAAVHIGQAGARRDIGDIDAVERTVGHIDADRRGNIQRDGGVFVAGGGGVGHSRRIDGGIHRHRQRMCLAGIGDHDARIGVGVGGRGGEAQVEIIGVVLGRRDGQAGQLIGR